MADRAAEDGLPPGTVSLVALQEFSASTTLVLVPRPSEDPNDPLNWTTWRKYANFTLLLIMTGAVFTNLQMQTILWAQMGPDLGATQDQLTNSSSAQLAGLAVGCILFIPFAVKYGRRPVYLVSTALLVAAAWWTSEMKSAPELFLTNLLYGLAGAVNETCVQMTISDMFFVHQRATANAWYFAAVMIGSFLTPIAAGVHAAKEGWRWVYYASGIAWTAIFLIFIVAYEETKYTPITFGQSPPNESHDIPMLDVDHDKDVKDATAVRRIQSNPIVDVNIPMNSYQRRMRLITKTDESLWQILVAPLSVVSLPHVIYTSTQLAASIAWLITYATMASIIFSAPPYNYNTAGVGYVTGLGPFVGNVFGNLYGGPLSDWLVVRKSKKSSTGYFEPEMRLHALHLPVFFQAAGLMIFGATADRGMHWIYPSLGGALFGFGLGANGDIAFTLIIDTYRGLVAEAFIAVSFFRNAISAAVPFALVPWWTSMGLTNMFVVAGAISLAIGLTYVPMIIWGKRIRIALASQYWKQVERRVKKV